MMRDEIADHEFGEKGAHTLAIMITTLVARDWAVPVAAAKAVEIMWYVNDHHVRGAIRRERRCGEAQSQVTGEPTS